jgi:hypothetical protein
MLKTLKERSKGMTFFSPDGRHALTISAIMYVDDNTPGVNDMDIPGGLPLPRLFLEATNTAQTWEQILFASGGSLELSKCFTTVIAWDWTDGIPTLQPPSAYSSRVTLTRGMDPTSHILRSNPPELGERTLGVRPSADGNWDDKFAHHYKQVKVFARQILASKHSKDTYNLAYRSKIHPSMTYPLCISSMTPKQCDRIDITLRAALLPALGYARNLPLGIALGPSADGGLDIHSTHTEQGLRKVTTLIGHLRQGGRASALLRIAIDWCQLLAGVSYPILSFPARRIPHAETCWITTLRDNLRIHHLSLNLTSTWCDLPQRAGDFHLMDRLGPLHTPLQSRRLNQCRLWLHVSRLSDITHTNGKTLLSKALYGDPLTHRRSGLTWPRVPRPPDKFWKIWRHAILRLVSIDGKTETLRSPLGPWNNDRIATEWHFLYDPATDQLLSRDSEWLHYRAHPSIGRTTLTNRRFGPPSASAYVEPSHDAVPVLARKINPVTFVCAFSHSHLSPTTASPLHFLGFCGHTTHHLSSIAIRHAL